MSKKKENKNKNQVPSNQVSITRFLSSVKKTSVDGRNEFMIKKIAENIDAIEETNDSTQSNDAVSKQIFEKLKADSIKF